MFLAGLSVLLMWFLMAWPVWMPLWVIASISKEARTFKLSLRIFLAGFVGGILLYSIPFVIAGLIKIPITVSVTFGWAIASAVISKLLLSKYAKKWRLGV
jgi:hypothetical protein